MNALSRYLAPLKPGRGVLLWGEHLRPLAAAAAIWGVARHAPVWVVDAANRFDPYQLVREASRHNLPPQEALLQVRVARAFTSHQLVRLLQETFPASLESGSLVLVLGPVSLFYDEQVPLPERRRLFQDLVTHLTRIKAQSALLLLQPILPRAANNQHFGRLLAPVIDYFVKVGDLEGVNEAACRIMPEVAVLPTNILGSARRAAFFLPPRGDH
jgi:Rad51